MEFCNVLKIGKVEYLGLKIRKKNQVRFKDLRDCKIEGKNHRFLCRFTRFTAIVELKYLLWFFKFASSL